MFTVIFQNNYTDSKKQYFASCDAWTDEETFEAFIEDTGIFESFCELVEDITSDTELNLSHSFRRGKWRITTDTLDKEPWEEFVIAAVEHLQGHDVELSSENE